MTIAYSINGGSEIYGIQSDWQQVPIRVGVDGVATYNDWAINKWSIDTTDMTTWETLKAAEGTTLTSLETNDIDARNSSASYATVIFERLEGGQVGHLMRNVTCTFRVDTTS